MAEESTSKTHMAEPIVWLLGALFIFQLLLGLPGFVQDRLGVDTSFVASFFQLNPPLVDDTPIGTKILNKKSSVVRNAPGGSGDVITRIPRGSKGTVIGGPVSVEGGLWWQVKYNDGITGWVSGDDIAIDLEEDNKALKENTPSGNIVQNKNTATIYSSPIDGIVVGTKDKGANGKILAAGCLVKSISKSCIPLNLSILNLRYFIIDPLIYFQKLNSSFFAHFLKAKAISFRSCF